MAATAAVTKGIHPFVAAQQEMMAGVDIRGSKMTRIGTERHSPGLWRDDEASRKERWPGRRDRHRSARASRRSGAEAGGGEEEMIHGNARPVAVEAGPCSAL